LQTPRIWLFLALLPPTWQQWCGNANSV
jgi:hypothetical protein